MQEIEQQEVQLDNPICMSLIFSSSLFSEADKSAMRLCMC